jgi:TonB family protein
MRTSASRRTALAVTISCGLHVMAAAALLIPAEIPPSAMQEEAVEIATAAMPSAEAAPETPPPELPEATAVPPPEPVRADEPPPEVPPEPLQPEPPPPEAVTAAEPPPPEPLMAEPPPPEPELAEAPPEPPPEPVEALPEPPPPAPPPPPVERPRPTVAAPRPQRTAVAPAPAPVAPAPSPAPAAPAAPAPRSAAPPASYIGALMGHLERHKVYSASARARRAQGVAELSFTMRRDGTVISWRLVRGAGDAELDEAVETMIRRASPLPAPPADVGGDTVTLVIPVRFRLNLR